ncbi:MAG TPA: extracellular solute-binding protein [Gaiellaceae bacterium]|jgi:iron(III) transport system substrate-binding protein|nr:extracellular solute-binding protein [Gaiellaceae bacterium]
MDGDPPPRHRLRIPGGALAVALLACLAGGCGGSAHQGSGQSLTVYNGQYPQTTAALVSAFEKATGIGVKVRSNEEAPLADEIVLEGSPSRADVIYTENSPVLEYLQGKGLLAHLDASTLARTPAAYDSPAGDWVGVSARASVVIYNPKLIAPSEVPTTAAELADPRYRGKLALAPAEPDFQPIVTSMDRRHGKTATLKWLEGIKANSGNHIYSDNEAVVSEINRGTAAVGIVEQFYWYRLRAELGAAGMHTKISFLAPRDPGYVVGVSGAAVLRNSRHQAEAQKFVAFLVSPKGQAIIGRSIEDEYLFHGPASPGELPFDRLQPNSITIAQLGDGAAATALLRKAGLL